MLKLRKPHVRDIDHSRSNIPEKNYGGLAYIAKILQGDAKIVDVELTLKLLYS